MEAKWERQECPDTTGLPCTDSCQQFTYRHDSGEGWAGVYWQSPSGNWGSEPGIAVAPGASAVRFVAWSSEADQVIDFLVGYSGQETFANAVTVTLTSTPTEYVLPWGP